MPDLLVPVIEPTALQEARNLARGSAAITIPAPTGGLNRREAEADMPLDQATRLVNLVPEAQRVRKRGGYRTHVHLGIDHDPVINTVPPQLAVPPPLFVLPGGEFFERGLLGWLEAEYEPINFELVTQLPEWLEITRHGALYGYAPLLPQDRTFTAGVRAADPALNHLLFDVHLLVVMGRPAPDLEAPTLATRRPRVAEANVRTDIGAVADSTGYTVQARKDGGEWATVYQGASRVPSFALPGTGWELRARADGRSRTASGWTVAAVPDQEPTELPAETLDQPLAYNVTRNPRSGVAVRVAWGAQMVRVEVQKDGGDWWFATDPPFRTADLNLPGTGWRVRLRRRMGNAVGPPDEGTDVPDQTIGVPAGATGARFPAGYSPLVQVDFDPVANAARYEIRYKRAGDAQWTSVTVVVSSHLLELPGENWQVEVRAIPEPDDSRAESAWSETINVAAQGVRPIEAPAVTVEREERGLAQRVRVGWDPIGPVLRFAYQTRRNNGAWSDAVLTAKNEIVLELAGGGWELRFAAGWEVQEGFQSPGVGPAVAIQDQQPIDTPINGIATRNPDNTDATVDVRWRAVPRATAYRLQLYEDGEASGVAVEVPGTSRSFECAGANWSCSLVALAPAGYRLSDPLRIDILDQEQPPAPVPEAPASNLAAARPTAHQKGVSVDWMPHRNAVSQEVWTKRGAGEWARMANFNDNVTNSHPLSLVGSGWRVRLRSYDGQMPDPVPSDIEVAVPDQIALGAWAAALTRQIGNASKVTITLARGNPRSGAEGQIKLTHGAAEGGYIYQANTTALTIDPSLPPGAAITVRDLPGPDFVAAADGTVTTPTRATASVSGLAFVRDPRDVVTVPESERTGDEGDKAANKDGTLSWFQTTDYENAALYAVTIKRKAQGAADDAYAVVPPVTNPAFDLATKKWACKVDADQRNQQGDLGTVPWVFRVEMAGYQEAPDVGAAYQVASPPALETTAEQHIPPLVNISQAPTHLRYLSELEASSQGRFNVPRSPWESDALDTYFAGATSYSVVAAWTAGRATVEIADGKLKITMDGPTNSVGRITVTATNSAGSISQDLDVYANRNVLPPTTVPPTTRPTARPRPTRPPARPRPTRPPTTVPPTTVPPTTRPRPTTPRRRRSPRRRSPRRRARRHARARRPARRHARPRRRSPRRRARRHARARRFPRRRPPRRSPRRRPMTSNARPAADD